jgi:hypothetical protein
MMLTRLISVVVQPRFHSQPATTQIPSILVRKKVKCHQGGPNIPRIRCYPLPCSNSVIPEVEEVGKILLVYL